MQITKHIHALKIPFKIIVSPEVSLERFVYVYLIYGKKIYLIDTGVASAEEIIINYIKNTGRLPEDISMIIQTHSHPDHIGATKAIKMATGCRVAIHPAEKAWVEDVNIQARERPVPGFHNLVGGSFVIDSMLNDGEILELEDDVRLQVLHTPGHSRGSVSLLFLQEQALFSGDAVLLPKDLPIYEDFYETLTSIKRLRNLNTIKYLLASWDEPREGNMIYQLMDNSIEYLLHIHEIVKSITGRNKSIDPMELCRRVVDEIGLPKSAVSPMLVKSFLANLECL